MSHGNQFHHKAWHEVGGEVNLHVKAFHVASVPHCLCYYSLAFSVAQHKTNKYEKHFPKMYGDVGMAVPKTTQTRYMDGSVLATQMTTQVTPSLHHFSFLSSTQSSFQYSDNKA